MTGPQSKQLKRRLSRVVWSEGMFLGPHQFQAQNAYVDNLVDFSISSLWFQPYGFASCALDPEKIRNGVLSVIDASGFLDDGTPFQLPDPVEPLTRDFQTVFPPAGRSLTAYLALPTYKLNGRNFRKPADPDDTSRYVEVDQPVLDINTGMDEKPVTLGKGDFRILFETESTLGMTLLPLTRIVRSGARDFAFDERFIPPCVQITASSRLMSLTEGLIDRLAQKSASMADRDARGFRAGLSERQVASFWFAHALNSALAPLRHVYESKSCHPERLYRELLRLGGALCTFGLHARAGMLPLYDHAEPERCFHDLERHILDHLELIGPTNCLSIPLTQHSSYFYRGEIKDQRCLGASRWVLGVRSSLGEADLIRAVPRLIKVCSDKFIVEIVKRAVPGLTMEYLSAPPSALSPRPTTQYYSLSKAGPCWEHIQKTKEVGIYAPGDFPNVEIELLVILDT